MNRKQITIIIIVISAIVLVGIGVLFYSKGMPFLQTIGLFPGEGQPVGPREREDDEEVNIPLFIPGVDNGVASPRLYELHKVPVAGVGFMETGIVAPVATTTKTAKAKAKTPVIVVPPEPHTITTRYIERGLGHIYETPLSSYVETRIVNETRPRIAEAFFGNNSKSVAVRYLDEAYGTEFIATRVLNLVAGDVGVSATSSSPVFFKTEEVFLPDFIPFMAVAEDNTDSVFYLLNTLTSSAGTLANTKGAGMAIFSSFFTEWLPQFPNQNLITLTTRPASNVPGYFFFLDTKTKALTKVLDGINGLTTKTSRDGKLALYSMTRDEMPNLFVYDVAKKESRELYRRTLPEKCAWSAKEATVAYCAIPDTLEKATYPDQWYRGTVSFSDTMWKIDVATGRVEKVFAPADYRAPTMDIINPILSSDDSYLLFMNKMSGTPWVYRIAEIALVASQVAPFTPTPVTTTNATMATTTITNTPSMPSSNEGMTKIK